MDLPEVPIEGENPTPDTGGGYSGGPISIPGGGGGYDGGGGYNGPADFPTTGEGPGGGGSGSTEPGDNPELREFEFYYRKLMSQAEIAVFDRMDRGQQIKYLINAQTAFDTAEALYPGPGLNDGIGDAYRHALFTILNVRLLGAALAKTLGDAHEVIPNPTAEQILSRQMDLYNNGFGLNWPIGTGWSASQSAQHLLNSGQLKIVSNGSVIYYIS